MHRHEAAGGRNTQRDTTWELTEEDGQHRNEIRMYRLTVRVQSARPDLEYVWNGNLCLTPWGQCSLEEMRQARSDGRNAYPPRIPTGFLLKEIRDPREAMRLVAAACRQSSLGEEDSRNTQAREGRKALREVERILAEGAHRI